MSTSSPSLVQLAEQMLEYAKALEQALPGSPDFESDAMRQLPASLGHLRLEAIATSDKINDLVRGCRRWEGRYWKNLVYPGLTTMCWQYIIENKIAQAVPVDDTISYVELAKKVGQRVLDLKQVMRFAMSIHLFCEPKPGYVAHTIDTKELVQSQPHLDEITFIIDHFLPTTTKFTEATGRWPGSQEVFETAFNVCFDTDKPMYQYLAEVPERQRRFGSAMTEWSCGDSAATAGTALLYPWSELAGGAATVVDVAGGTGHISILLAQQHSNMSLVVQDLPGVADASSALLTPDIKSRVTFMHYNYFDPQPVQDADAYFFSMIFHNQSDKYAIMILRNLIPALKPGARILIIDREVGHGTELNWKTTLAQGLIMKMFFNGRERSLEEKIALFEEADPRFRYARTIKGDTSFTITEAVWTPNLGSLEAGEEAAY